MGDKDDDENNDGALGVGKYPVMPSLVALQQTKYRLQLAKLGKRLMKWTALATGRELRLIAENMMNHYEEFEQEVADCYIDLARCRYYYHDLNKIVLTHVPQLAEVWVSSNLKSISGVKVICFGVVESGREAYEHLGIGLGGMMIRDTKERWRRLLLLMITITELRNNFETVQVANANATKKEKVLGKIIIPKIEATIRYILGELEEKEREETFRLKRVKQKKDASKIKVKVLEPEPEPEPEPEIEEEELLEEEHEPEPVALIDESPESEIEEEEIEEEAEELVDPNKPILLSDGNIQSLAEIIKTFLENTKCLSPDNITKEYISRLEAAHQQLQDVLRKDMSSPFDNAQTSLDNDCLNTTCKAKSLLRQAEKKKQILDLTQKLDDIDSLVAEMMNEILSRCNVPPPPINDDLMSELIKIRRDQFSSIKRKKTENENPTESPAENDTQNPTTKSKNQKTLRIVEPEDKRVKNREEEQKDKSKK